MNDAHGGTFDDDRGHFWWRGFSDYFEIAQQKIMRLYWLVWRLAQSAACLYLLYAASFVFFAPSLVYANGHLFRRTSGVEYTADRG